MNDTHLEQPDIEQVMADLTDAFRDATPDRELRQVALNLAVRVFLKPASNAYPDILALATTFHKFLSSDVPEA